jgi:DNA topoisomerase-3
MKKLVFAEKPSVGRDIARVLGAGRKGQGFLEGDSWIITWGIGHLVSIAEPGEQNPAWKKWTLDGLPMIPATWKMQVLPNTAEQFRVVKSLLERPDIEEVINAADAGREGELIFRLVFRLANCTKPFRRLWISSMTDEAIKKGFAELKPGTDYDRLAAAAECRMRSDWLVGLNFTRCYTKKTNEMLTLGRVQTPTLAMVVKRHLEILDFKPVAYWEIQAQLGDFSAVWFDPKKKDTPSRIDSQAQAQEITDRLQQALARVQKVTKTKKTVVPPFLYDLTTLQREANSRYGLTAAQTLAAAQMLYEQRKAITYPRTDSRHLSGDMHATMKERIKGLPADFQDARAPLLGQDLPKLKRVFDDKQVSDHHAIIPTEKRITDFPSWRPEEKKVYELVTKRFLAVFYPDHEYLATTITLAAGNDLLKALGKTILVQGWRALYDRDTTDEEKEDEQALPVLKEGETRTIQATRLLAKQTKPPPAFTESSLLQSMETAGKLMEDEELRSALKDSGLGTPATRAEIIEKLIRVGYMIRDKKKLVPTPKGIQLISLVDQKLKSPELTGEWEKRLTDIARKTGDAAEFMRDISAFVADTIKTIKGTSFAGLHWAGPASKTADPGKKAPSSTGSTSRANPATAKGVERTSDSAAHSGGAQRPRNASSPAPASRTAPQSASPGVSKGSSPNRSQNLSQGAAQSGSSQNGAAQSRPQSASQGATHGGGGKIASEALTVPASQRPSFGICPACEKGRIIEGSRGFGCDRWKDGCTYVVWKTYLGKKLGKPAITTLIAGKATRIMKGFVTEDGRTVSGKIRMREDRTGIEFLEFATKDAEE